MRGGLALLALCLGTACDRCSERKVTPAAEDGAQRAPRSGVKVPLPDGWTAQLGQDQSFRAGPFGRVVLRIDLRPGAAEALPTPEQLEARLSQQLQNARVERVDAQVSDDVVVATFALVPYLDGSSASVTTVALGAKRIGADLFLCSTQPGASAQEVRSAALACQKLSLAPSP